MLSLGHSYTVCITFLEPHWRKVSWLSADCKRLSCSDTTRCTILQFYNSILGHVFIVSFKVLCIVFNSVTSVHLCLSQQTNTDIWTTWKLIQLSFSSFVFFLFVCFCQTHNSASVWRRDPGFISLWFCLYTYTYYNVPEGRLKTTSSLFLSLRTLGIPLE